MVNSAKGKLFTTFLIIIKQGCSLRGGCYQIAGDNRDKLKIQSIGQEPYIDVLTIPGETTPADASPNIIDDLRLTPLHRQVEVAVIGIDTVLNLSPKENGDGLVIDIDSFTFIGH